MSHGQTVWFDATIKLMTRQWMNVSCKRNALSVVNSFCNAANWVLRGRARERGEQS
jgi:hypothetical protein